MVAHLEARPRWMRKRVSPTPDRQCGPRTGPPASAKRLRGSMKAIVFHKSIPRYAASKLLGAKHSARAALARWGPLRPIYLEEVEPKPLPTQSWVRVAPRLSGICGSDLSVICSKGSPYFSPLTSTPFVLGHEVVGTVSELGREVSSYEDVHGQPRLSVGDRVVLEPALGCRVRGIEPLCGPCRLGQSALCRNVTRGDISAGIQTGYCRDTGGGWSGDFVAHRSQLHVVPSEVDDVAAVLAEPLACVLHGILRLAWRGLRTVLVMGCGSIGLLTIAALRAQQCPARIAVVAKYPHQRRLALQLGADVVLDVAEGAGRQAAYAQWAEVLDAELHFPEIGKPTVVGGADATFECVASSSSLDDSIRFTASRGNLVLIGMPGVPANIDWTAIWYKELSLHATYAYGIETTNGLPSGQTQNIHTCELALQMLRTWGPRLAPLVGKPYPLTEYRQAVRAATYTGQSQSVKTVFGMHT